MARRTHWGTHAFVLWPRNRQAYDEEMSRFKVPKIKQLGRIENSLVAWGSLQANVILGGRWLLGFQTKLV